MQRFELTPELEGLLRDAAITSDAPGFILHDFQLMLDFVDQNAPVLTNRHLLSLNALTPLNQRLLHRIEHGLSRPQQKSFPYINGLYLLLRASGLTVVNSAGRRPVLEPDTVALQAWNKFNADER